MRGSSARSAATPADARTPAERLEALAVLRAGVRARLDQRAGFLASLDDVVVEAHLANDLPEELGTWPDPEPDSKPA
jgi:hypothetical protein